MEIFVLFWALLPFGLVSSTSESDLHHYLVISFRIRALIRNVSTFLSTVDHKTMKLAKEFRRNVSTLRSNYGTEMYEHYRRKYGAKASEFSKNPKLNEECQQYMVVVLEENEEHQTELSYLIAVATDTWRIGFNNLHSKFSITRVVTANIEKEAYECGILFSDDDPVAPSACSMRVLKKMRQIKTEVIDRISDEVSSLTDRKNSTLAKLYNSVKDRFIPIFYNEHGLDRWLENHCSE